MKNRGLKQFRLPIQFLGGILGFLSVVLISFNGYQKGDSPSNTLKIGILSLILISIIVFYIQSHQTVFRDIPYFNSIFIFLYIVSQLLIFLTKGEAELHLWMLGGLSVAMFFDVYLGYLVTYNMIFMASFIGGLAIESIVFLLVVGTLLCMLSNYLKNSSAIGYAVIIILSMQIVMLFIINSFVIEKVMSINAVYSLMASIMVIIGAVGSYSIYQKIQNQYSNMYLETAVALDEVYSLEEILAVDFPLFTRLKNSSPKLYEHSLLISEISGKAAKAIGANEQIAKAGGMYHEIGRLEGKQYVDEGIKLAKEYLLPTAVVDIIKQHNLKYDKPKSPEAAIVMMSVSFISTKEYLEKNKKSDTTEDSAMISTDKIVDNLFQLRLSKGSLNESGLTIHEFNLLKEFYLHM